MAALPGAPRPAHAASLWARRPQRVGKAEGKAGGVCVCVCVGVGVFVCLPLFSEGVRGRGGEFVCLFVFLFVCLFVCLSLSRGGERGWGVKKVKREERGETGRK